MLVQAARHCPQHCVISMWRRKSLLLGALAVTCVFVVCLQYSSSTRNGLLVESRNNNNNNNNPDEDRGLEFPLGMGGNGKSGSHRTLIPRRNLSALNSRQENAAGAAAGGASFSAAARMVDLSGRQPPRYQSLSDNGADRRNLVGAANPDHSPHPNAVYEDNHLQIYDGGRAVPRKPPDSWPQDKAQSRTWQYQQNAAGSSSSYYVPPLRVVHFDLKGAPPKMSYYRQIFPILREAGANAIMMEYEDMFPYSGPLKNAAAKNAYSREDIKTILGLARLQNFEVIPLVQTFGHLEFALKLQEFRDLREVDDFPQAICPSKNESFTLIENIIDQVMELHPNVRWLHVGCDEVYHIGYCSKCMRLDRDNIFLSHVARVAQYVRDKHKVIPIVWDDMLRQMPVEKLKEYQLGTAVEPMVWTYVKDVYRFVPYNVWMMYSEVFPFVWAASAFKGAFGETLTVPNVKMHLENNEAWLEVMAEQQKKFANFRGIAVTGWQRYDHLAALCELFPAGIPSLVLNLLTLSQGFFSQQLFSKFNRVLSCTVHQRSPVDFDTDPHLWLKASSCFFPGSAVFRLTQHHSEAIKRVDDYLYDVTIHKAWLTEYNVRHNITSPMRIDEGLTDYSSVYYPLTSLVRTARDALREVYDEYTVAEWIEQNIYPYIVKMDKLYKDASNLKKLKVWPKRPLPPLESLKKYSVGELEDNAAGESNKAKNAEPLRK